MPNSQRDAGRAGSQQKVKPCSECSRLKLKCSRSPWPCHSCRQRNLSHLCPEGQLSTRPYKKRKAARPSQQSLDTHPAAEDVWSAGPLSGSHSPGNGLEGEANGEASASGSSLIPSLPLAHESVGQAGNLPRHQYDEDLLSSRSRASLPSRSHLNSPPAQGSTGILFLADQALGRPHDDRWSSGQHSVLATAGAASSGDRPEPLAHAKSASPTTRSARGNPSTHTASGSKLAQDVGTGATEASKTSSRRASVDAGLLIENAQGNYSFYGPQSHSYNLAQLFAGRASPSLALPPLRGLNGDATQAAGPRGERSPAMYPKQSSFSPEGSQASSSQRGGLPTSAKRACREQILREPASFLVFPGMPSPYGSDVLVQQLGATLPGSRDARRAFEIYRRNAAWLYDPLPSLVSLWEEFYGGPAPPVSHRPLRLALLFSVLCVGTLFDVGHSPLRQAELSQACDSYYQYSWAACAFSNLLDSPCLEQVQTIQILGQYLCNRANGSKADSFFPLVGMAMRTAVTLGLHRGSALRGCQLSDEELQSRHQAFWELYCHDAFRSLAYGRPCSVQDQHCDTPFPTRGLARSSLTNTFHEIKYETARVLNRILDLGQRTDSPAYSDVLALDRSLRRLWGRLPTRFRSTAGRASLEALQDADDDSESYEFLQKPSAESDVQIFLQGNTAIANISQSLLHLHRPWFVRALRSKKSSDRGRESDILDSPYARSVVAVSESSRSLIDVAQSVLESTPTLSKAMNFFWHHCFNAAVCQCLHTLQEPSSVSALGAWDDVRRAISILRRARPDRSDVVWAGKLELLEALQMKTEERLTNTTNDGRATDKEDSRRASIAEHLPLVGGGSAVSGPSRRKPAHAKGVVGMPAKPRALTQGTNGSSHDDTHSGTAPSISPLTDHAAIQSMTSPVSITTATSQADEWLNTLSDDLAGFLTSRQRQQRQQHPMDDAASHSAGLDIAGWQQANEWSNAAGVGEPMVASSSQLGQPVPHQQHQHQQHQHQQQGIPPQQQQTQHAAQSPSAIEPSQSWNTLLADLLQVGCEPDTNFWAAIARDGR